jgi:ketosteroid isomerase-like protein
VSFENHQEVIREVLRRWNSGDRSLDPDLITSDIRVESTLSSASYEGADGFERWIQEIEEQFDRWDVSYDELLDAGPNRMLVLGSIRLRGRESGVEFDQPAAYLCEFRDGRISKFTTFPSHDEGREAAGLPAR